MNRYPGDVARERIIRWHIKHYPRLETRDLVKLAYQDVFGNRHFQSGREDALEKIRNEIKNQTPAGLPNILIEPVSSDPATGNAILRGIRNAKCRRTHAGRVAAGRWQ